MAGLVLATWSLEGAEEKLIKLLRKCIKLTIKIAISHSGITPLLRSFLRLRRPAETSAGRAGETLPLPRQKVQRNRSWRETHESHMQHMLKNHQKSIGK